MKIYVYISDHDAILGNRNFFETIKKSYLGSGAKLVSDWDFEYWKSSDCTKYRIRVDVPDDPSFLLF